jgi:hypothetical protein
LQANLNLLAMQKKFVAICIATLLSTTALWAQEEQQDSEELDMFDLSLKELLGIKLYDDRFMLYGFINANVEKVMNVPSVNGEGQTVTVSEPISWSPVQNFHLYGSGNLSKNIGVFFNLAYNDRAIEVREAYGNFKLSNAWQIRVGQMYRRFGLYNERLDQIPTFVGIEPPELFDTDHLFLTRTTNLMLHGERLLSQGKFMYALTSGQAEGGSAKDIIPLGWDFRYQSDRSGIIVGTSGYSSSINGQNAVSTVSFNDGPARGGILPWMDGDQFAVFGGFVEKRINRFLIQSAYWRAEHSALRNAEHVLTMVREAGINQTQRDRFLGANAGKPNAELTTNDVITEAKYATHTFYTRLSYSLQSDVGQFVPYVFYDELSNPEVIANKAFGGDNEAGITDNGRFTKLSIGVVYRPINKVAIKLDMSSHVQEFNGEQISYPEVRLDFSFGFDAFAGLE